MAAFLIGYDLKRPGQNYSELFDAIKATGSTWWHCLDSTWIVITAQDALSIANSLWAHMDANDKLLVIEVTSKAAWGGLDDDCTNWLKRNL